MFDKMQMNKENILKIIVSLVIASIFLLTLSILTDDHDSRKQVGGTGRETEEALTCILSEIEGVKDVSILVQYGEKEGIETVTGVIITAHGTKNPIIKNNILKGVATLYDIPASSVAVFEKGEGGEKQ